MSTPQEVQSPAASAHAAENGGTQTDSELLALLDREIAARKVRVDELRAELADIEPELKRYERVRTMLTGETPTAKKNPLAPSATKKYPKRVAEERLAAIERVVRDYAKEHEEFTQVEIRALLDGALAQSSTVSTAFEALRQRNVIRFARQDGLRKMFRLTREAVRESDAAKS